MLQKSPPTMKQEQARRRWRAKYHRRKNGIAFDIAVRQHTKRLTRMLRLRAALEHRPFADTPTKDDLTRELNIFVERSVEDAIGPPVRKPR